MWNADRMTDRQGGKKERVCVFELREREEVAVFVW